MPTVEDLGKRVKAKHPEYRDMPDVEVGRRVKAKFADYSDFEDVPEKKTGVARFVETAEPLVNPVNIVSDMAEATSNPTGFVQGILGGSGGEYDRDTLLAKAQEFAKTGDYAKAARYAIGYAIPFFGGQITEAGDMMEAGDIAGGLGKTFGLSTAIVGPKYVPKVAAKTVAKTAEVAQKAGPVAKAMAQETVRQLPFYEPITAIVRAGKEAANKGKTSPAPPPMSATEKFNRLLDEAKATAPTAGEPRVQFPPAPPKRIEPRPVRRQEPSRVEAEEPMPPVRADEPPYIPPTIEERLAGLSPEAQEAIRRRRAEPVRGPVPLVGQSDAHGPMAAPLKRPPAAEIAPTAQKAAPDARATAEMLADQLDEAVDSTTRANLSKKLTPEQMAEAEELAAAMGQPAGQRPSLGKVVVEDAEVGAQIAAANRTAQAEKMAAKLNETGITADMAQRMTPEQWRQVQYAAGADPRSTATHLEKPPSAATQAEAIEMLRKMEKPKGLPSPPTAVVNSPRYLNRRGKTEDAKPKKPPSVSRAEEPPDVRPPQVGTALSYPEATRRMYKMFEEKSPFGGETGVRHNVETVAKAIEKVDGKTSGNTAAHAEAMQYATRIPDPIEELKLMATGRHPDQARPRDAGMFRSRAKAILKEMGIEPGMEELPIPPIETDPAMLPKPKAKKRVSGARAEAEAIEEARKAEKSSASGKNATPANIEAALSGKPMSMEKLSEAAGIPIDELVGKLMELQLSGVVKQLPGELYTLWKK